MRLTSKAKGDEEYAFDLILNEKIKIDYNHTINADNRYFIVGKLLNKLGQLEDIEEELGIELITLFKALKQGYIYYPINCPNDCYKYKIECLYMKPRIHLYVADGVGGCYMEDYGKTWALTMEELL